MVIIQGVLISLKLFTKSFVCHLDKCKGACCWEGDFGAPLTDDEIQKIGDELDHIMRLLPLENQEKILREGYHQYYQGMNDVGTTLMDNKACVFMTKDESGIAHCGIEQAHNEGNSSLRKPMSCHMYPIRIKTNNQSGLERMEYDDWEICSPACALGEELQVPVYRFLKEAIIRKYGQRFYEELDAYAEQFHS